uniref:Uncharacterized protein n=1 Tax=Anguilla anguilla TaxID=7936 RepID=A0A0E9XXJ9_ANGAN
MYFVCVFLSCVSGFSFR